MLVGIGITDNDMFKYNNVSPLSFQSSDNWHDHIHLISFFILGIIFMALLLLITIPLLISFVGQDRLFSYLLNSTEKDSKKFQNKTLKFKDKIKDIPKHIAVIMDGNRRFGIKVHSDALQGHWVGGQNLIDFSQWCISAGIKILTVYAFSTENWNRDPQEIIMLMDIFAKYAENLKREALARNVSVRILSTDPEKLPVYVRNSIEDLQSTTKNCDGFIINLCISYGSRTEILNACKSVAQKVLDNEIKLEDIDETIFSQSLVSKDLPDPDILIRTSGEFRLSNFLLWQLAYTEMFFINKYWPEVSKDDLYSILEKYSQRNRRYGK